MERFDIDNINKRVYTVGTLNQKVIDLLGLTIPEAPILFSDDKIKYTAKHAHKFDSYEQYKTSIEAVPDIISNPDYVARHLTDKA